MTTEIEWWDYDDAAEMAQAVAGDIAFVIESAIDARGAAVIALAGGKTPLPIYDALAKAKIDWKRVTIVPGDERLVHWPLDLCLLGVGGDGHAASIFPGPDYDEALNGPKERRALGVMPDPLPPEAPVARVTLSRQAIITARALMIAVTGDAKRQVIEDATKEGASSPYPIGRILADVELPVDIHWAP